MALAGGTNISELCRRFEISRANGYKRSHPLRADRAAPRSLPRERFSPLT